jgi:NhaP-type Na+/H+ and K+/H+ antiporter
MRRSLLIGLAVLVVLVSVIQGTAMQKQTTIPGLLFPSTTPTLTHADNNADADDDVDTDKYQHSDCKQNSHEDCDGNA